ncbi:S8 family serine peptidase [Mariniluteicoccus endophyticus]
MPKPVCRVAAFAAGLALTQVCAHPAYAADGDGEPFSASTCIDYPKQAPVASWATERLKAEKAWPLATGKGVRIAVLDTGIDTEGVAVLTRAESGHQVVRENYNFAGWDAIRGNGNEKKADCTHGTKIAALIAGNAQPGSGTDFTGIAPDADIIGMRTLQAAVRLDEEKANKPEPLEPTIKAIRRAIDLKVDIINISAAGTGSPEYERAISDAIDAGIVVVAAAGNSGSSASRPYPASYPGVIAVGMTDARDVAHPQSQSHERLKVTVAAPGVDVLVPNPSSPSGGAAWQTDTGTSFAAPQVAGVVALMLEREPDLTPAEVKQRLQDSADPPPAAVPDKQLGHGIVNPYAALTAMPGGSRTPGPTPKPPPGRAPLPNERPLTGGRGADLALVLGGVAVLGTALATALYAAYPFGRRRNWRP